MRTTTKSQKAVQPSNCVLIIPPGKKSSKAYPTFSPSSTRISPHQRALSGNPRSISPEPPGKSTEACEVKCGGTLVVDYGPDLGKRTFDHEVVSIRNHETITGCTYKLSPIVMSSCRRAGSISSVWSGKGGGKGHEVPFRRQGDP